MKTSKSVIRFTNYSPEHYSALKSLMQLCYANMGGACVTEEEILLLSQLYPEGQILCFVDDVLVGGLTSRVVPFEKYSKPHTQEQIADITTFIEDARTGNSIYGLDTFSHPDYAHLRVGRNMTKMFCEQIQKDNFDWLIGMSRVSSFANYPELSLSEYVSKVVAREIRDQALSFHLLTVNIVLDLAENFNPDDLPSRGCGVVLGKILAHDASQPVWPNRPTLLKEATVIYSDLAKSISLLSEVA